MEIQNHCFRDFELSDKYLLLLDHSEKLISTFLYPFEFPLSIYQETQKEGIDERKIYVPQEACIISCIF